MEEKNLFDIHKKIYFHDKRKLNQEIPEQLMALKHIKEDNIVLELGGSIGRNSCVINYLLKNKNNHVVIEPNLNEVKTLEKNRSLNNFLFKIETSVLSHIPLYSRRWETFKNYVPDSTKVNNISFEELKLKYNLCFDTLVIDSEGNFTDNLRYIPDLLKDIRLLIIEHDFNSEEDLNYFNDCLNNNNFKIIDCYKKTDKFGPPDGMNFAWGVKTDPIFVSVWKKET